MCIHIVTVRQLCVIWSHVLDISVYTDRDGQTVVCYLESCVRYICVYRS